MQKYGFLTDLNYIRQISDLEKQKMKDSINLFIEILTSRQVIFH